MAGSLSRVFLVGLALAGLLQISAAQTVHVVGNTVGWMIPQGGAAAYTNWAAGKTFAVGDILVFNFPTGQHDVAQVTKTAFDSCNGNSPISAVTSGPANITLNSTGEHYFICRFPQHCSIGQKLAVNVTASAPSPAPQTSAPTPASSPAPVPSPEAALTPVPSPNSASTPVPSPKAAPTPVPSSSEMAPSPAPSRPAATHVVGGTMGWTVPSNGSATYENWARGNTFLVGDTLVFNFNTGVHNVAEVSKAAFDSCNSNTTISQITRGPARVTLTTAGNHYYICTVPSHCSLGQKLAVSARSSGAAATPQPSPSTPPSSSVNPSPPAPAGAGVPAGTPANSAPSFKAAAGFSATLLSAAVVLLF